MSNATPKYSKYCTNTKKGQSVLNGFKIGLRCSKERVHLADHLNLLTFALVARTASGLAFTGG